MGPAARSSASEAADHADVPDARRWHWVLLAVVVAAFLALRTWVIGWDTLVDFQVYRGAALTLLGGEDLYAARYSSQNLPFTYPPFAGLTFLPLAALPHLAGSVLWYLASVAALLDACVSLRRWSARHGWQPFSPVLLTAAALPLEPFHSTLGYGQINLFLLALLLRDVSGRTPLPQGVLTGLCAGVKLTPAAFGLYFLLAGRVRAAFVAGATAVGSVALAWLVFPQASVAFWLGRLFTDPSRTGTPWYATNQSLTGVLSRWTGPETGAAAAAVLAMPVVAAVAYLTWRAVRDRRPVLAFAAFVPLPLLVSPISWSHHWVLMLVPVAALLWAPWRGVGRRVRLSLVAALLLTAGSSLMSLLPHGGTRELAYGPGLNVLATAYLALALLWLTVVAFDLHGRAADGEPHPA